MILIAETTLTLGAGTLVALLSAAVGMLGTAIKVAVDVGAIRGALETRLTAVEKKADQTEARTALHAADLAALKTRFNSQGCPT